MRSSKAGGLSPIYLCIFCASKGAQYKRKCSVSICQMNTDMNEQTNEWISEWAILHDSDVHCFHDCAISRNKLSRSANALGIQFHFFLHSLNLQELKRALYLDFFFLTNMVMLIQKAHWKLQVGCHNRVKPRRGKKFTRILQGSRSSSDVLNCGHLADGHRACWWP